MIYVLHEIDCWAELSVQFNRYTRTPIAKAFVESAERLNYTNLNYNGGNQIGVAYLQSSTQNGWRQTAAKAFLSPVKHRPNLDISLKSWATKLVLNKIGDQVKAVKFYRKKYEHIIKARKEVILAAGAFESPKLLMLSGIGPEKHLKEKNIEVVKVIKITFFLSFSFRIKKMMNTDNSLVNLLHFCVVLYITLTKMKTRCRIITLIAGTSFQSFRN